MVRRITAVALPSAGKTSALGAREACSRARARAEGEAEIWRSGSGFKRGKLSATSTRLKKKEQIGAASLQRRFSSARGENDTFSMCSRRAIKIGLLKKLT